MWHPSNHYHLSRPSHQPLGQGVWGPAPSSSCRSYQSQRRMGLYHLVSSSRKDQVLGWTASSLLVSSSHRKCLSQQQLGLPPQVSSSRMEGLWSRAGGWMVWELHPSSHHPQVSSTRLTEKQRTGGFDFCLKYFWGYRGVLRETFVSKMVLFGKEMSLKHKLFI